MFDPFYIWKKTKNKAKNVFLWSVNDPDFRDEIKTQKQRVSSSNYTKYVILSIIVSNLKGNFLVYVIKYSGKPIF